VPQLAEDVPFAIVPILGECLVVYWLEHLASLGAREVIVVAADRPEQIQAAIGEGQRWGIKIKMVALHSEPTRAEALAQFGAGKDAEWMNQPHDAIVMDHLPGSPDKPLFDSYSSWFAALVEWMPRALTAARVRISEIRPGVWVGTGARIDSSAKLHAPCWVGDHVTVDSGAVVGPNAILEGRAVLSEGAQVIHSVVGPDTLVGRLTAVVSSLASGNCLINWHNDSILRVPDSFLLCSLSSDSQAQPGAPSVRPRSSAQPLRRLQADYPHQIVPGVPNQWAGLRSKDAQ
jgi:NDP-sugar pyrophosphorylase family protein